MNAIAPIAVGDPMRDDLFDVEIDTWAATGWREAAVDYHNKRGRHVSEVSLAPEKAARLRRLIDGGVSLDRAWRELDGRRARAEAPDATVEALMFSLRSRGVQALEEPNTMRRLGELNDEQLREVAARLQKLKPHVAAAWSAEGIEVLMRMRGTANDKST